MPYVMNRPVLQFCAGQCHLQGCLLVRSMPCSDHMPLPIGAEHMSLRAGKSLTADCYSVACHAVLYEQVRIAVLGTALPFAQMPASRDKSQIGWHTVVQGSLTPVL